MDAPVNASYQLEKSATESADGNLTSGPALKRLRDPLIGLGEPAILDWIYLATATLRWISAERWVAQQRVAQKRVVQKKGAGPPCCFVVWFHWPRFQQSASPISVQGPLLLGAALLGAVPRVHHLASKSLPW